MLATAVKDVTSAYILGFVLDKFPSNVSAFRSSLGYEIVSRLSRSLSQLPYPFNEQPEDLDDRCRHTQVAPTILEDLSLLLQSSYFEKGEFEGRSNKKTTQQHKSSRHKATTGVHAEINDRLSQALGSQVPRTRESAEKMIMSIVDNQKDTLRVSTSSSGIVYYMALLIFRPVLFHLASTTRNYRAHPHYILSGGHTPGGAGGRRDATGNRSDPFIVHHWGESDTG